MHVTVVGAGIVGLTCALRLAEAGHDVDVLTDRPSEQTTSAVAAALWYPYRALPQREVTRWAAASYAVLADLAGDPATGVRLRSGEELFRDPAPDPWWRDAVPALGRVAAPDLPEGFRDGLRLTLPVVDMSVHLPWLLARLAAAGVDVELRAVAALEVAAPQSDVVVDCAGLGARGLTGDRQLVPVRGQVVVVEQVGVSEWLLSQTDPVALTYVVPRERTVVLGGTAEEGREDLEPDPATAREVVARCAHLVPALSGARVLGHKVGLRPARSAVRLETGRLPTGQRVVHDYGHGGAGVTLSYGCAEDVVALVEEG
jgi:D-amino-acid oxidase